MNINIICVGKLKEKYLTDACKEYIKRISRFAKVSVIELADEPASDKMSRAEEEAIINKEGAKILEKIGSGDYVIALCVEGKQMSSPEMAFHLSKCFLEGKSTISFVIGGSLGLSPDVKKRSNYNLSFSKMTFPHQLMRVILLEQIYRCFKINANESYHK